MWLYKSNKFQAYHLKPLGQFSFYLYIQVNILNNYKVINIIIYIFVKTYYNENNIICADILIHYMILPRIELE